MTNTDDSTTDEPVDYRTVDLPPGKPTQEYTWRERRAALLATMASNGEPHIDRAQTKLASDYDVSQGQISQDLSRVRESISYYMGESIKVKAQLVFESAVDELQDAGDHYKAAKVMQMWLDAMADVGEVATEPDKHEVRHSGAVETGDAPDALIATDLSEQDKEHLDRLKSAAEADTASTRIDESGDDLDPADLGLD